MMRRYGKTTLTARICQTASMLLFLATVLAVLAPEIARNENGTDAKSVRADMSSRLVLVP
jgi:hypothetical protein